MSRRNRQMQVGIAHIDPTNYINTIERLSKENNELKDRLNNLAMETCKKTNEQILIMQKDNQDLRSENSQLKEKVYTLTSENVKMSQKIIELENENKILKQKINILETQNNDMRFELAVTNKRIDAIINGLSLRDFARTFEKYIILEIIGSKTKIRKEKINTIKILRKKYPELFNKSKWYDKTLLIDLIGRFMDDGNKIAHGELIDKNELSKYLNTRITDYNEENGDDYEKIFGEFVNYLDIMCKKYGKPFGISPFN